MALKNPNEVRSGDVVLIDRKRVGFVEDVSRYVVSGNVAGVYVRWAKRDGSPGKRLSWIMDPVRIEYP